MLVVRRVDALHCTIELHNRFLHVQLTRGNKNEPGTVWRRGCVDMVEVKLATGHSYQRHSRPVSIEWKAERLTFILMQSKQW
jgi:hypothetical protein